VGAGVTWLDDAVDEGWVWLAGCDVPRCCSRAFAFVGAGFCAEAGFRRSASPVVFERLRLKRLKGDLLDVLLFVPLEVFCTGRPALPSFDDAGMGGTRLLLPACKPSGEPLFPRLGEEALGLSVDWPEPKDASYTLVAASAIEGRGAC